MNSNNSVPKAYQEDEIDLFELAGYLWRKKWLIVGVTAIVIGMAVIYLVVTPNVYKNEVSFTKTDWRNLSTLNLGQDQLGVYYREVSPELALSLFKHKLNSKALAREYFTMQVEPVYRDREQALEVSSERLLEKFFLEALSNTEANEDNEYQYQTVSFQYTNSALTAKWLNGYIQFMEEKTKEELLLAAESSRSLAMNDILQKITDIRNEYKKTTEDRIARLEEAAAIAKSLDFMKPVVSNIADKVAVNSLDESLLYMRGYNVLAAEIKQIKARDNIDHFIGIRPLEQRLQYLKSLNYNNESEVQVIDVDELALESEKPVKPKKALILVLAGLLGGMLGVFVVLVSGAISKRKQ